MLKRLINQFTYNYYLRGLPRILFSLRSLFVGKDGVCTDFDGHIFRIDPNNQFQYNIIWGYYEDSVRSLIKKLLKSGDIFVDIGANIGYFSILSQSIVGKEGQVYSFEPNIEALANLRENARLNNSKNITVIPKATSDYIGTAQFNMGVESAFSTLVENPDFMQVKRQVTVDVTTVDEEMQAQIGNLELIALVKIDVEGNEIFTLKGMQKLISCRMAKFIIENNPNALKRNGHSLLDLIRPFLEQNYHVYWIIFDTENKIFRKKNVSLKEIDQTNIAYFSSKAGDILLSPELINF